MPEITEANRIFNFIHSREYHKLLLDLMFVRKYSLEEDSENHLGTSILTLTLMNNNSNYAEELIYKTNAKSFQKGQHFEALHGITNNRTNCLSILKAMIDAGFDIADIRETKNERGEVIYRTDVFNEIAHQAGRIGSKNYEIDLELIITLLETKKVVGFEGDLAQPLIDDLKSRKVSLTSLRQRESLNHPILGTSNLESNRSDRDINANPLETQIPAEVSEIPNVHPFLFTRGDVSDEQPVVVKKSRNIFSRLIPSTLWGHSK